jgi:hypothetical protein
MEAPVALVMDRTLVEEADKFPSSERAGLKSLISSHLAQNCDAAGRESKTSLSLPYTALIRGILPVEVPEGEGAEELLLGGEYIGYSKVLLTAVHSGSTDTWSAGRMLLSSDRLFFVCHMVRKETSVYALGRQLPTNLPNYFIIDGTHAERSYFHAVPLRGVRGISFNSQKAWSKLTALHYIQHPDPPCYSLCSCCCTKEPNVWRPVEWDKIYKDDTWVLRIGVLMPPWGDRTDMFIYLKQDTHPGRLQSFLFTLQSLCPQLRMDPSNVSMAPRGIQITQESRKSKEASSSSTGSAQTLAPSSVPGFSFPKTDIDVDKSHAISSFMGKPPI